MNGLSIEVRCGDLFEPVGGERFSLVVCQSPYMPRAPGVGNVTFAHGGGDGDELLLAVLRGLHRVLAEDALAIIRADVPSRAGRPTDGLAAAVGPDLDLAAFVAPGLTADSIAVESAALSDPTISESYSRAVAAMRAHLRRRGIEKTHQVLAVLRSTRPASGRRAWRSEAPLKSLPTSHGAIERYVASQDVAVLADQDLDEAVVRYARGLQLVSREQLDGDGSTIRTLAVDGHGLEAESETSEAGALLFSLLDGDGTVAEASEKFGRACGIDPDDARAAVRSAVRLGLERGLLTAVAPLGPGGSS